MPAFAGMTAVRGGINQRLPSWCTCVISAYVRKSCSSACGGDVDRFAADGDIHRDDGVDGARDYFAMIREGLAKDADGDVDAAVQRNKRAYSRSASARLTRSAIKVHATPESRYTLTATRPKREDRPNATSGAKAAPISQAKSDVSAAPV